MVVTYFLVLTSQQLHTIATIYNSECIYHSFGNFLFGGGGCIHFGHWRGCDWLLQVEEAEGDLREGALAQGQQKEGIDSVELGIGGREFVPKEGTLLWAAVVGLGEEQAVGSPVAAEVVGAVGHGTEREEDGG